LLDAYVSNGSFEEDQARLTSKDAKKFCAVFRGAFKKQSSVEDVEKGKLVLKSVTRLGFEHHLIPILKHGLGERIEEVGMPFIFTMVFVSHPDPKAIDNLLTNEALESNDMFQQIESMFYLLGFLVRCNVIILERLNLSVFI
jgi:hypothetical protein